MPQMAPTTCLLLAVLCTLADGLQSSSWDGSSVHVEGLSPHNWDSFFDPLSPDAPRVRLPPKASNVRSFAEAAQAVQEGARAVGRQMGVPYMPHDFRESLSDGSVDGVRTKTRELFNGMKRSMGGIDGIIDFGLSNIGTESTMDAADAFKQYSMVAERVGAKSIANQFAPLLRSTTPPNPTTMFNMIGNALTSLNMPAETIRFYQELGRMYGGAGGVDAYRFNSLRNRTMGSLWNRTQGRRLSKQHGTPDYYKSTSNAMIVLFRLPCLSGSQVCFALTNEFYSFKNGPGYYGGAFSNAVPGGYATALGVATQTPWSMISTPFYLYPTHAVGHEYDLKFVGGLYPMANSYVRKPTVSALVKIRESSDCLGTGKAVPDSPRVDTCPFACFVLTGGRPQVYSILEVVPTRTVGKDTLASLYDLLKWGGPVMGALYAEMMPAWAWAGFYRAQ